MTSNERRNEAVAGSGMGVKETSVTVKIFVSVLDIPKDGFQSKLGFTSFMANRSLAVPLTE